ncbi:hypothetical protein ABW19_dt0208200 [Dactylella cylindrospora]|nr:hypothetical protein ABW19_dt0208200 [Dactylella cylindrospora]
MTSQTLDYISIPLVLAEEFENLNDATVSVWNSTSKHWIPIFPESLRRSMKICYVVRDSGIHLLGLKPVETQGSHLKKQYAKLGSLVFGKPNDSSPILFNYSKTRDGERRGRNFFTVDLTFRPLDEGIVFTSEYKGEDAEASVLGDDGDIHLTLKAMIAARNRIRGSWDVGSTAWVKIESEMHGEEDNEGLELLQRNHRMFKKAYPDQLPWVEIMPSYEKATGKLSINTGVSPPIEASRRSTASTILQPYRRLDLFASSTLDASPPDTPKTSSSEQPPAIEELPTMDAPNPGVTYLASSAETVEAFLWNPTEECWNRCIPEETTQNLSISFQFQIYLDGVGLFVIHSRQTIHERESSPAESPRCLGTIQWRAGLDKHANIPFHLRVKSFSGGLTQPIYYFALPSYLKASVLRNSPHPPPGQIILDSASSLLKDIGTALSSDTNPKWLCVRGPIASSNNLPLDILHLDESRFVEIGRDLVPRQSKQNQRAIEIHQRFLRRTKDSHQTKVRTTLPEAKSDPLPNPHSTTNSYGVDVNISSVTHRQRKPNEKYVDILSDLSSKDMLNHNGKPLLASDYPLGVAGGYRLPPPRSKVWAIHFPGPCNES